VDERGQQFTQQVGAGGGESISQHVGPVDSVGSGHRVDSFARVDLGRPHEESRDDLYSFGYDMPSTLIRPDSYTTLLDATRSETAGEPIFDRLKIGFESHELHQCDESGHELRMRRAIG